MFLGVIADFLSWQNIFLFFFSFIYFNISIIFQMPLKVQSCKLYNNKYMIASTQIINSEIFGFIAVLIFKLLNRKVLFINRKDNKNC